MKKLTLFAILPALAALLALPLAGADATTTTRRDAQGRTTGTETTRGNTTTYRDAQGRTTGTKTVTDTRSGTTATYRDAAGRTTSTENTRKQGK